MAGRIVKRTGCSIIGQDTIPTIVNSITSSTTTNDQVNTVLRETEKTAILQLPDATEDNTEMSECAEAEIVGEVLGAVVGDAEVRNI